MYEQYSFDNVDNLVYKWDRKNQQLALSRDAQNRVIRCIDSGNTVYYTYDAAGRMTQAQDNTGTYGFTYDNMGRLTETTTNYAFLTARGFNVQYAYDAASNRTTLTDPESGTTHYTYDTLNRLTGLNDFQSHNFTFSYDALSRRTQLTRPNGINTNYSYDNVGRFVSEDPIGFTGGVDFYRYVENNAVKSKDPTGLATYQCTKPLHAFSDWPNLPDGLGGGGAKSSA